MHVWVWCDQTKAMNRKGERDNFPKTHALGSLAGEATISHGSVFRFGEFISSVLTHRGLFIPAPNPDRHKKHHHTVQRPA